MAHYLLFLIVIVVVSVDSATPEDLEDMIDYDSLPEQSTNQSDVEWNYFGPMGPSNWSLVFSECRSSNLRQSPINISPDQTEVDDYLDEIKLVGNSTNGDMLMNYINDGRTVTFSFPFPIYIFGGDLGSSYRVFGVHFHWGDTDSVGSEHTIQGRRFPLEMHIVAYDEARFDSVRAGFVGLNSLAVLSVLFTLSEHDNPVMSPVIDRLKDAQVADESKSAKSFSLSSLLPVDTRDYYRYLGSLTTPPCAQVVVWTVFATHQTISSDQLSQFRRLHQDADASGKSEYIRHNWRPTQRNDGRLVKRSCPQCSRSLQSLHSESTNIRTTRIYLVSTCPVIIISCFYSSAIVS